METKSRNTRRAAKVTDRMIPVTVVSGDTLSGIASDHGTTWQVLAEDNPSITNPNLIYVGETVLVPSGGSYSSWTPSPESPSSAPSTGDSGTYSTRAGDGAT